MYDIEHAAEKSNRRPNL